MNANIGINKNKVVELYEDPVNNIVVNNLRITVGGTRKSFGFVGAPVIAVNARKGEPTGTKLELFFGRFKAIKSIERQSVPI